MKALNQICVLFLLWVPNTLNAQSYDKNIEPSERVPQEKKSIRPGGGWSITGLTGLNFCLPSGAARCDATYPGFNFGLTTEYKWTYLSITGNLDWGQFTLVGAGDDELSHHFGHLGLGVRAYLPSPPSRWQYLGVSLGSGDVEIKEDQSDSSVTWSSLWSDLKLSFGAVWLRDQHFSVESALSLLIHLGGERCIQFSGAGPCRAVKELPEIERSSSRTLMLRIGLRWTP